MANKQIEAALLAAFDALPGAVPSARDDILLYADQFEIVDGCVQHLSGESPSEYLQAETVRHGRHSHWVGPVGSEYENDRNPWGQNFSLTRQGEVVAKYGAVKAAELAAAVSSKIGATKPSAPLTDEAKAASKNPWSESGFNLTRQGAITKALGEKVARAMCAAAGCQWGATRPAGKPIGWTKPQTAEFTGVSTTVDISTSNPFTKSGFNLSKIATMVRDNPKEAERLAAAAGTSVAEATSPSYTPRRSLAGKPPPEKRLAYGR